MLSNHFAPIRRLKPASRGVISAALLGVCALIVNVLSYRILPEIDWPIGNVFIFLAAGSLGIAGTLTALITGIVPEIVWSGDYLYGTRIVLLFLALALWSSRHPRSPMYALVLTLWLFLFGPVLTTMQSSGLNVAAGPTRLFYSALGDILVSMFAGIALLNPTLWGMLHGKARQLSAGQVLAHITPLLASVAMLAAMAIPEHGTGLVRLYPQHISIQSFFYLIALGVVVPATLGWMIGSRLKDICQDFYPGKLSANQPQGFSGVSSDYWRRKSSADLAASRSSSELRSSSGTHVLKGNSGLSPEDGICALTGEGTITFVNRRFLAMAELGSRDVLGKRLDDVGLHSELARHLKDLVRRTIARGNRVTELKINKLPDKLRFFEISSMKPDPLDQSSISDGPESVIVVIKDITERRTVESHLLQAQKLGSLGNLVSGIAHSFNNTLTTIVGHASFAQIRTDTKQTASSLAAILTSAQGAGTLVHQLLDFAEGKPSWRESEDLGQMLDDRLDLLKKLVGDRYEIQFERPATSIPITSDPNLIMQAITNLVLNAKDAYNETGGKIAIILATEDFDEDVEDLHLGARPGKFARLRVKDSGAGMSSETLSHVFEPLFTTKSGSGHSGLGLSIVFSIVRAHDGFLTVESRPDKGTTVSLYLPLHYAAPVSIEQTQSSGKGKLSAPAALTSGEGRRLLVVEDEPSVRELVATMLGTFGYSVDVAASGAEALTQLAERDYDLVIADLMMPKMRGPDLILKIRQLSPGTRTLLMSGYGSVAEELGDTPILSKPFDMESLRTAVNAALARNPAEQAGAVLH